MTLAIAAAGTHVEVEFGTQELLLLGALPGLLAGLEEGDDPAYERLNPMPYGDDDEDREYRRLAVPDIERARTRDSEVFSAVMDRLASGRTRLTRDEAESYMRTVGAGRLAIAARHGMFDQATFDRTLDSPEGMIVTFLGYVQDELVAALTSLEDAP